MTRPAAQSCDEAGDPTQRVCASLAESHARASDPTRGQARRAVSGRGAAGGSGGRAGRRTRPPGPPSPAAAPAGTRRAGHPAERGHSFHEISLFFIDAESHVSYLTFSAEPASKVSKDCFVFHKKKKPNQTPSCQHSVGKNSPPTT